MKLHSLLKQSTSSTKKGVASLYVVVFATILFGVITLSFTRIIISESSQSSDSDLSTSAYDAAQAGVEDAKLAVNKYYTCKNNPSAYADCSRYTSGNLFSTDTDCSTGFPLAQILYGSNSEVKIQEKTGNPGSGHTEQDTYADQAYTCVIISDITPDYRGTLTKDTRTRVIPLRINGVGNGTGSQVIKRIRFSWYSDINQGKNVAFNPSPDGKLRNTATVPPTIQLNFIKAPASISLQPFRSENNSGSYQTSTMIFVPASEGLTVTSLSAAEVDSAGNANYGNSSNDQHIWPVAYSRQREFASVVDLHVNVAGNDNAFLVASLPYGDAFSDFAVTLYASDNDADTVDFKGVQISVDSTGRTNQLLRRVETRLDPADLYFPYPQYAFEINNRGGSTSILKNFWVTANCWTEGGHCSNNGSV